MSKRKVEKEGTTEEGKKEQVYDQKNGEGSEQQNEEKEE